MSTQQELDLEARIGDLERQIAELAAKVNPLYSGGMDRYIHSGYLQWDGIGMRFDDNGQQVLIPDGNSVNSQFWVAKLSNNPSLPPVGPKIQIGGAWTTSSPERVTYSILAALTPTSIANGPNSALTMQGRSDLALVQLAADFEDDGAGVYFKLVDDASNPRIVWSLDGGVNENTLGGGGMSLIVKEANETVNNSNTLQDDDELLFAVAANEVWQFEGVLNIATNATPDFQLTFTGPTGAVGSFSAIYGDIATGNADAGTGTLGGSVGVASANGGGMVRFWGGIHNGANAGNLTLKWAQLTADASNTTVYAGSYIKYQKET